MKRQLTWMLLVGATALFLSACQQQNSNLAFQQNANVKLASINQILSAAKAKVSNSQVASSMGRGFTATSGTSTSTASSAYENWVPYNNYYQQAQPTTELQEAETLLAQLPVSDPSTFQLRIAVLYQAAKDTYTAENALATNQYQNLDSTGQQYSAYNNYWRYPSSYSAGFSSFFSGSTGSFLNTYNNNGFLNQSVYAGGIPPIVVPPVIAAH